VVLLVVVLLLLLLVVVVVKSVEFRQQASQPNRLASHPPYPKQTKQAHLDVRILLQHVTGSQPNCVCVVITQPLEVVGQPANME